MTQGLWRIVSGASKRPTAITVSSPGGSNTSTTSPTEAELEAWDAKAEKASGWIFLMLEDSQTKYWRQE